MTGLEQCDISLDRNYISFMREQIIFFVKYIRISWFIVEKTYKIYTIVFVPYYVIYYNGLKILIIQYTIRYSIGVNGTLFLYMRTLHTLDFLPIFAQKMYILIFEFPMHIFTKWQ